MKHSLRASLINRKIPSWFDLFIVSPWVIGVIFLVYGAAGDRTIAKRQRAAYAMITAHEPNNHDRYGYKFFANGQPYDGWDSPARPLELGQQVLVYYDPIDPAKNALTEFGRRADQERGPVPTILLGIIGVATYLAVRRIRYKNRG